MRIRSFVIAYALVLAILLFADHRPDPAGESRYTRVLDLTEGANLAGARGAGATVAGTRIVSPAALIPGTWGAGQIPAERLVAPLVVVDLIAVSNREAQITLDDIAAWETKHGVIPQGAVVAIRRKGGSAASAPKTMPITTDAAQFLMDARYALGFAVEATPDITSDRTLARQIALHGSYVVEGATRLASVPEAGSVAIVAPMKSKGAAEAPVRLLAMVR
jgi:kynurenine formamidase